MKILHGQNICAWVEIIHIVKLGNLRFIQGNIIIIVAFLSRLLINWKIISLYCSKQIVKSVLFYPNHVIFNGCVVNCFLGMKEAKVI
jgi:hypothetical protein